MKIEIVNMNVLTGDPVKAYADIRLEGEILIQGLMVKKTVNGVIVVLPEVQERDEKLYQFIHSMTSTDRDELNKVVLDAYYNAAHA